MEYLFPLFVQISIGTHMAWIWDRYLTCVSDDLCKSGSPTGALMLCLTCFYMLVCIAVFCIQLLNAEDPSGMPLGHIALWIHIERASMESRPPGSQKILWTLCSAQKSDARLR